MRLELAKKAVPLAYADASGCCSIVRHTRWTGADSVEYSFTLGFDDGRTVTLSSKEVEELGLRVHFGHTMIEMKDGYRKLCERIIDEPERMAKLAELEAEAAQLRAAFKEASHD